MFISLADEEGDQHLVSLDSIADITYALNEKRVGLVLHSGTRLFVAGTVDDWKTWLAAHGETVVSYP